jgi:lactate dehydrogenase-like 2-hydroxyacid dehydrogenase
MIAQTGRVGSNIDLAACTERGVAVAEGVGSPIAPAELTWALVMAATRRLPQYISSLKHGAWQQSGLKSSSMPANFGLGTVLKGKTLGIWGYGKIGQLVAGYGKAFGMHVQIWGSDESRVRAVKDGHAAATSREAFFQTTDVLTLHLRLNEATTGIVTNDDLGLMKPTSLLVNTSRAELVETNALIGALNRGRPGMAAVDVFESEPILQGSAQGGEEQIGSENHRIGKDRVLEDLRQKPGGQHFEANPQKATEPQRGPEPRRAQTVPTRRHRRSHGFHRPHPASRPPEQHGTKALKARESDHRSRQPPASLHPQHRTQNSHDRTQGVHRIQGPHPKSIGTETRDQSFHRRHHGS